VDCEGDILLAGVQFGYELTGNETTELGMDYQAPEAYSSYTEASDVYSLGKVFLYIATAGAAADIQRVEFRSLPVYQLIRKMTEKDPTKRLQLNQYSHDFISAETHSLAETATIPSPSFHQIRLLIRSLPNKDLISITKMMSSDYDFLLRTRNPLARLYEQLVSLLESIKNDRESSVKLTESEQSEARKAGLSALKAALLYQQTKLYDYAKYCYSRALLAYYLAGELVEGGNGDIQHYLEVRRGKAACYASLSELAAREI
jgi:serine/threonine protein kinase